MADGQRSRFRRDRIGVAFQDPYLLEELNVTDNIELVLRFRKRRVAAGRSDVGDLLEAFGLGDRAADRLVGLSGGERQRVSLARAILSATALLVADEPTASLDHANALQVIDALVEQATARGIPLVVATHDSDVAARMEKTVDLRNA